MHRGRVGVTFAGIIRSKKECAEKDRLRDQQKRQTQRVRGEQITRLRRLRHDDSGDRAGHGPENGEHKGTRGHSQKTTL